LTGSLGGLFELVGQSLVWPACGCGEVLRAAVGLDASVDVGGERVVYVPSKVQWGAAVDR
jgi:hypothetical protein